MIGKINIENELRRLRRKLHDPQNELLKEAKKIIRFGNIPARELAFPVYDYFSNPAEHLDQDRIFSLDEIRSVCINYRLRFLDLSNYKDVLPSVAFKAMHNLENRIGYIPEYKLIAPASFFRLKDRDKDPLLFAQITEDKFYLVTKWGNDLSPLRAALAYPFRTIETFLISLTTACFLFAFLTPVNWITSAGDLLTNMFYFRALVFCWSLIGSFFFLVFLGLTFRKNFSDAEWDSHYFN